MAPRVKRKRHYITVLQLLHFKHCVRWIQHDSSGAVHYQLGPGPGAKLVQLYL